MSFQNGCKKDDVERSQQDTIEIHKDKENI